MAAQLDLQIDYAVTQDNKYSVTMTTSNATEIEPEIFVLTNDNNVFRNIASLHDMNEIPVVPDNTSIYHRASNATAVFDTATQAETISTLYKQLVADLVSKFNETSSTFARTETITVTGA